MNALKVNVTEELIEHAIRHDSRSCMISNAIKAERPDFKNVLTDLQTIRWTNPRTGKRYICLTPLSAGRALVDFDAGRKIEPFTLLLKPAQITPATGNKGKRKLIHYGTQPVISGGRQLPAGHLRGSDASEEGARKRSVPPPADGKSNVELSRTRYRQYGLRLLRD